ncbi:MAG: hypothetical protein V1925_03325 [Candidatus Omnitrophota bacterium]
MRDKANVMLKVVLGLALLILGAWAILAWWPEFLAVVKGCIGLFLLLAAAIILVIAKE